MPELPEVETVRRGLAPAMVGARLNAVDLRRNDIRFPFPEGFGHRLTGRQVEGLGRRAKYLLFTLDSGETLIAHLGMSGSFRIEAEEPVAAGAFHHERSKDPKHDHVVFHLDNGKVVTYNDPRRFGFMDLADAGRLDAHPRLAGLGLEPLGDGLDGAALARLFNGSRAPLKAALLNQKRIAGLGNIYVCEALFRAGLAPTTEAGRLANARGGSTRAGHALAKAIREVLEEAVLAGGSTLRDHRQTDGELGYFQHAFRVYDREGLPCLKAGCRGVISRMAHGGRSTFYCRDCQKE